MQLAIVKRGLEEPHCGDQAGCWEYDGKVVLCIIDGLGHGKHAEHAAMAALDVLERHYHEPLLEAFATCDKALRDTHGVVMGIAVAEGQVAIMVKDTGPGLTPDQLEKVFEPLCSTRSFGVGLGLSIVKQIAQQHGGNVEMESQAGEGAAVTLYLPLAQGGEK